MNFKMSFYTACCITKPFCFYCSLWFVLSIKMVLKHSFCSWAVSRVNSAKTHYRNTPWMHQLSANVHPFSFLFPPNDMVSSQLFPDIFKLSSKISKPQTKPQRYFTRWFLWDGRDSASAEGQLPGNKLLFPSATINRIYNLPPKCL